MSCVDGLSFRNARPFTAARCCLPNEEILEGSWTFPDIQSAD
jgi:hypothetical protein